MIRNRPIILLALAVIVVAAIFALRRGTAPPTAKTGAGAAATATGAPRHIDQRILAAPRPGRASGAVVDGATGKPIAGATVELLPLGRSDREERDHLRSSATLTRLADAQGSWRIDAIPPGSYRAAGSAKGYLPGASADLRIDAGQVLGGVRLELTAGGNRLHGTISDISGGPVAGATVQVTPLHGVLEARTNRGFAALADDRGQYDLHMPDGRFRVRVFHGDYMPRHATVELRGGPRRHDVSLIPGAVVEGTVRVSDSGLPVPNAIVAYRLERTIAVPGSGRLTAGSSRGSITASATGTFRLSGLGAGTLYLTARAAEGGLPAFGTSVAPKLATASTVRGSGATGSPRQIALAIGEQRADIERFLIEPACTVLGRVAVIGDRPEPAIGVLVTARTGEQTLRAARPTDRSGRFAIVGLRPGSYTFRVESDEHVTDMMGTRIDIADCDSQGIELAVEPGAMIEGRVNPPTVAEVGIQVGAPGDAEAWLKRGAIRQAMISTQSEADGHFRLGPVEPGALTLSARAADGSRGERKLSVPPTGAKNVVIDLRPGASISGKVVDQKGAPVADAKVRLVRARAPTASEMNVVMMVNGRELTAEIAPTHEDGTFVLRGLEPGRYEVRVQDALGKPMEWVQDKKKRPEAPMPIELAEGEQRTGVVLRVEAHNHVIRGVAKSPEGEPAADVWVTAALRPEGESSGPPGLGPGAGSGDRAPIGGAEEGKGERRVEMHAVIAMQTGEEEASTSALGFAGAVPPVLTDDRGRFVIRGLKRGVYHLAADSATRGARGGLPDIATGSNVTIAMHYLTSLRIKVVRGGKPVEAYTVSIRGPSSAEKTIRSADGEARFDRLDPGEYNVLITAGEGGFGEATAAVRAGAPSKVTVELRAMARVVGKAITKAGDPVAGALVLIGEGKPGRVMISMDDDDPIIRTGADGSFTAYAAPGDRVLVVQDEETPMPLVTEFFQVKGGADIDLGTLTAKDPGSPTPPRPGPPPGEPTP